MTGMEGLWLGSLETMQYCNGSPSLHFHRSILSYYVYDVIRVLYYIIRSLKSMSSAFKAKFKFEVIAELPVLASKWLKCDDCFQ